MNKLIKSTFFGVFALVVSVGVVYAATTFVGTAGDLSADPDATFGGYYLRHVGNPAPDGYSHLYQWEEPAMTCDPNNTAVTFTGTVDVRNMEIQDVAMVGLVDNSLLADGNSGWASGAYAYVHRNSATTVRIGPTDGSLAGEIVQVFGIYTIPEDGIMDIAMTIHAGDISVSVNGNPAHVDDYGFVKSQNNSPATGYYAEDEFHMGATVGWDVFPYAIDMPYDFAVDGCEVIVNDPTTMDDCKNGGWEAYGFNNQGRCIQFVNTGMDSR